MTKFNRTRAAGCGTVGQGLETGPGWRPAWKPVLCVAARLTVESSGIAPRNLSRIGQIVNLASLQRGWTPVMANEAEQTSNLPKVDTRGESKTICG